MESKEQIIKIVTRLFAKYGVRSLSMKDIAWQSGLTKKKLYEYFKNKEEIVVGVVTSSYQEWKQLIEVKIKSDGNPIDILLDVYYSRFQIFTDFNPIFYTESEKTYSEVASLYKSYGEEFSQDVVIPLLKRAQEQQLLKPEVDVEEVITFHQFLFESLLHDDAFFRSKKDKLLMFKHWFEYPIKGMLLHS